MDGLMTPESDDVPLCEGDTFREGKTCSNSVDRIEGAHYDDL